MTEQVSKVNWNDLFLTGSIVDIELSMWRARTKIKASDLGIDDSPEVHKVLSLGNHRLFPAKAFEQLNLISGQAKRSLEHHSLNFAMIRGARYVPNSGIDELLGKLRAYKKEFLQEVEVFMQNYEKTKEEMLPVIEKALKDAARTPEIAETAFHRVQAEYPSVEEIRSKFAIRWSVYAIQSPKSSAAKEAALEETDSIKSVVRGMIEQLRGEVTEKLKVLTDLIGKGGKVPKQSIDSARSLINRIDSLNVMGDRVLTDQVRALGRFLDGLESEEDLGTVAIGIGEIQRTLESSIEEAVKEAEERLTGVGKRKLDIE